MIQYEEVKKKSLHSFITNILLSVIVISLSVFSGCGTSDRNTDTKTPEVPYITQSDFLLNTVITINLYDMQDKDILNECFKLIRKYENIYSRTNESSELYALNNGSAPRKGSSYQISDEMSDILSFGLHYSELSKGAFDITIEPVSSLWNFIAENPEVPDEADIHAALPFVGYKNITLNGNQVTFGKEGNGFDLGAIAKGYIADRVKEFLLSEGVKSAMINLGGNVICVGEKPDGTPFHVGIQKPYADRNETIAVMDISDFSVVSSGVYERYFLLDGVSYHHILNPKTGYPYDNNLISVTIISEKSSDGDGLSTTCFALGLEKGLELIASLPNTYAVFITNDYQIYYSEGFEEAIPLTLQ
jgi:thiamine biosynthesis lipoprotein